MFGKIQNPKEVIIMPQRSFSELINYITKGDEFIKNQWTIFEKYLKVSPDDSLKSVRDLIKKDIRQEDLKKKVPQLTTALEKETNTVFTNMVSKVKIVKGILEDKGKTSSAKSLRSPSSAKTMESRMNWLVSFMEFIDEYKSDLSGYPQLDTAGISNTISQLSQKKKERDSLEDEKRELTKYIDGNLSAAVKDITNWLRVAEGLLGIERQDKLIKQIPRQPQGKRKKVIGNQ
jgi:hypothetical protein